MACRQLPSLCPHKAERDNTSPKPISKYRNAEGQASTWTWGTHNSVDSTPHQDRAPQSSPSTRCSTARCRPGILGLWTQSWLGGLLCRMRWLAQLLTPHLLTVCQSATLHPLRLWLPGNVINQAGRPWASWKYLGWGGRKRGRPGLRE